MSEETAVQRRWWLQVFVGIVHDREHGKSQLTLKREKVVVFSRPPIVNRTARESHLFSRRICEPKVKWNPPVHAHAAGVKTLLPVHRDNNKIYNNPPGSSVDRIYIIFLLPRGRNPTRSQPPTTSWIPPRVYIYYVHEIYIFINNIRKGAAAHRCAALQNRCA